MAAAPLDCLIPTTIGGLLSAIGIVWADGTAGKTGPKGFVTNRKLSPYLHAETALLLAHQVPTPPPSKEELAQAQHQRAMLTASMPPATVQPKPRGQNAPVRR